MILFRKELKTEEFDYHRWFFGTGDIPRWAGYRIGYVLVEKYMQNKDILLPMLVKTKSEEIINI